MAGFLGAIVCVALAMPLFVRWWPPVEEGLASLNWPSAPGEIVYASFRSEYDAVASRGIQKESRDQYTNLLVAYWVADPGGESLPLATRRFDTAHGLLSVPGALTGKAHEIQHLLASGDALQVRYDPQR